MKRSGELKRTGRLKPVGARGRRPKPPEGPLTPQEWREAVWWACKGRTLLTGRPVALHSHSWDAHHPIPKRKLPPQHKWDRRNGIVLSRNEHDNHTTRFRVIEFELLPPQAMEFAAELGDWAIAALLREHPLKEVMPP